MTPSTIPHHDPYVVFAHDGRRYALPLAAVRLVTELSSWSRVPRAPEAIVGVTNLHGRVALVVDLGPLVGERTCAVKPGMKLVVLSRGDIGICAGEVELGAPPSSDAPLNGGATLLDADVLAQAIDRLVPLTA